MRKHKGEKQAGTKNYLCRWSENENYPPALGKITPWANPYKERRTGQCPQQSPHHSSTGTALFWQTQVHMHGSGWKVAVTAPHYTITSPEDGSYSMAGPLKGDELTILEGGTDGVLCHQIPTHKKWVKNIKIQSEMWSEWGDKIGEGSHMERGLPGKPVPVWLYLPALTAQHTADTSSQTSDKNYLQKPRSLLSAETTDLWNPFFL